MGIGAGKCIVIRDSSAIPEARRAALEAAKSVGFDEGRANDLAIVVSEIATNIHKHAGEGLLVLQIIKVGDGEGIEVLGLDKGPGIADLARSQRDGFSTSGTPGTGLGAISRIALHSDIYTIPGRGTALLARLGHRKGAKQPEASRFGVSAICLPKIDEDACGDSWFMHRNGHGVTVAVIDGLGHGLPAANASAAARRVFADDPNIPPAATLMKMHDSLRSTRGAAAAVARIDLEREIVTFAGIGNIAGHISSDAGTRNCVSHGGIVGGDRPIRVQEFTYPFATDSILVMHSDGLSTHWNLDTYAGLAARDPSLIAGVLFRDFKRDRDDVTVLVAKGRIL
jgi:anti-sigma regulatory factor (Ser/Thr protein kinase)